MDIALVKGIRTEAPSLENLSFELNWASDNRPWSFMLKDSADIWLSLDFAATDSGARVTVNKSVMEIPASSAKDGRFNFRMIVDGSVVEILCNELEALTVRVYSKPKGPLIVFPLISEEAKFILGETWQLKPISKDRLTT